MLKEALELHNHLNPALWDKNQKLLPEVNDRLHKIVNKFQSECMLPLDIVDVHLVGSNASFNYNPNSDLDVHIVVNFDLVDCDKEILMAAYNLQKSLFNKDYDISIRGINVELYIEDINSMTASNGIYSLYEDKWIKKPVKIEYPKLGDKFQLSIEGLSNRAKKVIESEDSVEITKMINMLYMMRKNGLAIDGEMSVGNLLFKEIRNLGLLDELKKKLKEVQSKQLTMENLTEEKKHKYEVPQSILNRVKRNISQYSMLMFDQSESIENEKIGAATLFKKVTGIDLGQYVVHHIDHIKNDNDVENLILLSKETHDKLHSIAQEYLADKFAGIKSVSAKEANFESNKEVYVQEIVLKEMEFLENSNGIPLIQIRERFLRG